MLTTTLLFCLFSGISQHKIGDDGQKSGRVPQLRLNSEKHVASAAAADDFCLGGDNSTGCYIILDSWTWMITDSVQLQCCYAAVTELLKIITN